MVWTQEHADAQLDADMAHAASIVNNRSVVKVDLTQGQLDALVDWLYNIKQSEFYKSTLLRVLNFGEYSRVPDELRRWIYVKGEPNEGLVARREGEIVLWNGRNPLEGK